MGIVVATSVSSRIRLERARDWLSRFGSSEELLIVGSSANAANHIARETVSTKGAAFGWHRASWTQLAKAAATPLSMQGGLTPITRVGSDALVAGVVHRLRQDRKLGRYEAVSEMPGFRRAVSQVINELRMARVHPERLAQVAPDLAPFLSQYEAELLNGGYSDAATVFALAIDAAKAGRYRLLGLPTLLVDVPIANRMELEFAEALSIGTECLCVVPASDSVTLNFLCSELGVEAEDLDGLRTPDRGNALHRLQRNLFRSQTDLGGVQGDQVTMFSAPGEGRECVEIVRRVLELAANGTRFDRVAVLLRSPRHYSAHLAEAFARSGVPAYFARGASRPDASGRAFVALLQCAVQNLSALRFAEYMSLDQLPNLEPDGRPPSSLERDQLWIHPDSTVPVPGSAEEEPEVTSAENRGIAKAAPAAYRRKLHAPRRWERLLVEAAVIGGHERWHRRIDGLINQLRLEVAQAELDESQVASLTSEVAHLEAFAAFALPLIEDLASLPTLAIWREWLERLAALSTRALRRSDHVRQVLAQLAPMSEVGPVSLRQVLEVITDLLLEAPAAPDGGQYGKVFVAPVEAVRGLSFDAVFVPGLAEKKFPSKIVEEPLLLDSVRVKLDYALATNQTRLDRERLALSMAVDAASERFILSYPRIDLDSARGQVPSFYALEVVRSSEGILPDFAELARRAEEDASSRLGWPAPSDAAAAIDDAEYDLSVLAKLMDTRADTAAGAGRYLLGANVHLGRALRARFQRWSKRWTSADGLLRADGAVRASLDAHLPDTRSYSPTALQSFASCPYKFLLRAVHGLTPRDTAQSLDELDPLQRGSIIHDVHFTLFERLDAGGFLPIGPGNLERAHDLLDEVLTVVVGEYRDLLAPAIERVWDDEIAAIRTDLREWLRRASLDTSGFAPRHFELSFGLASAGRSRHPADPASKPEPVRLDTGLLLRGSIDLVERHPSGFLRVTDYKTGKADAKADQVIAGGKSLQPVLYSLAAEKLFPGSDVVSGGRLYFSTRRGGFTEVLVTLDEEARSAAQQLTQTIGAAVRKPFLPAAPASGECQRCDYRPVCGPYEEFRSARKPQDSLEPLTRLRNTR